MSFDAFHHAEVRAAVKAPMIALLNALRLEYGDEINSCSVEVTFDELGADFSFDLGIAHDQLAIGGESI